MNKLLYIIFFFLFIGSYLFLIQAFQFSKRSNIKNLVSFHQIKNKDRKLFNLMKRKIASFLVKFIKLDEEYKGRFATKLKLARIIEAPEMYIANILAKIFLINLCSLIFLFVFPLFGIVLIALTVFLYFEEMGKADKIIKDSKEKIEKEIPRFTNQIAEEINSTSDVILMFKKYLRNAGDDLRRELSITIADMNSGNQELALSRFEARIQSPMLSELVRGLISLTKGDDVRTYFSTLSYNFRKEEIEKLRKEALKIPQKIKKYSYMIAILFILLYLIALGGEILQGFSKLI